VNSPTYQYDAAGNLLNDGTNTYQWDAEGRLTAVTLSGNIVSMNTYNALGQRVEDATQSSTTEEVYGAGGALLARYTGDSNSRSFVPFNGGLLAEYYCGGVIFDHPDELGSATTATDCTGSNVQERLYYPFGEFLSGAGSLGMHQMFAQLPDYDPETDQYNTPNRHYTPMGRWLTPDPSGVKAARLDDPQTWNMYAYARNNPTTVTDPSGLVASADAGTGLNTPLGIDDTVDTAIMMSFADNEAEVNSPSHNLPPQEQAQNTALDKVATAAEKEALGLTRAALEEGHRVEYGGWIIKSNKDGSLSYTKPAKGGEGELDIDSIPVPKGFTKVAEYHTHPNTTSAEGEGPSTHDINRLRAVAHDQHVDRPGYVSDAYSGNVYRYTQWEPIKSMYDTGVYGTKIGNIPAD